MRDFGTLTIRRAQRTQPWTLPYMAAIDVAVADGTIPHLLGSHVVLHASKSVGKLAAVFEELDHSRDVGEHGRSEPMSQDHLATIKNMSADLMTTAMRLANLYGFDLAAHLVARSEEKNRVDLDWPGMEGPG